MAKAKDPIPSADFSAVARVLEPVPMEDFLEKNFLAYAYMTILDRAIPDARDGMKPVQRRILYSMNRDGLTADKSHIKSARIVGNTMGLFHPHGDMAIYYAMAGMEQDFNNNVPLIDGYGNWGSPSDGPAAHRYTEARLTKAARLLLGELKEECVDFKDNYDNSTKEPVVLPARFPILLVNGASGIATGLACNLPPHNPQEVLDAARWLLTHPGASLEKLMEFVPGPDLPTGGVIIGVDGIKEAYETGRGTFRIRALHRIESLHRGKSQIVFTEMPYRVSIEGVIEKVKSAIDAGKLQGIADVKDLTDRRNGIRLVVETKSGVNPEALLNELFALTPLETSFGINNTVIDKNNPVTVGLKRLLEIFLEHRIQVVIRRSQTRLDRRSHRLSMVEALQAILLDIDAAVSIIRKSDTSDDARAGLQKKFKIDQTQAEYILSLQLRRLTRADQYELEQEKDALLKEIAELKEILSDESVLRKLVGDELVEAKKLLEAPRRSRILGGNLNEHIAETKEAAVAMSAQIADEPCLITLYASGAMRRAADPIPVSNRGRVDPVIGSIDTTSRGAFVAITNMGNAHRVDALHVSDAGKTTPKDAGVSLGAGERIVVLSRNEAREGEAGVALGTRTGVVKIVTTDYPKTLDVFPVIGLTEGDEVIGGGWVQNQDHTHFAFVSSDALLLRFEASKVRPQGRGGAGVAGMKLSSGATAVSFAVVPLSMESDSEIVTATGKSVKRSAFSVAPIKGRATGGQRIHLLKPALKESEIVAAVVGSSPVIVGSDGKEIILPDPVRRDAPGTPMSDRIGLIGHRI